MFPRCARHCLQAFSGFGGGSTTDAIDSFMFAKLVRECDLLSSRFTNTDVDIIFSQVGCVRVVVVCCSRGVRIVSRDVTVHRLPPPPR